MAAIASPFTAGELLDATRAWGCNCGPAALAFAAGVQLERARGAIPGFDLKRYTSPSMMTAALAALGVSVEPVASWRVGIPSMFSPARSSLVRVQWTGPWTAPGANPRWAYRHTHWVCAFERNGLDLVFDINGMVTTFEDWDSRVVPGILRHVERGDGGWLPTHVWRVRRG
jgi:hypothetical protein